MSADAKYQLLLTVVAVAIVAMPVCLWAAIITADWQWLLGVLPGAIAIRRILA